MKFNEVFKALGDQTRLRILNLFVQSSKKICVCEMVDALHLPQYHISRHLTVLRNAGLLETTRQGTWIYYDLVQKPEGCMKDLYKLIKKHFEHEYTDDIKRLTDRLALREDGACVLGYSIYEKPVADKPKVRKRNEKVSRKMHR